MATKKVLRRIPGNAARILRKRANLCGAMPLRKRTRNPSVRREKHRYRQADTNGVGERRPQPFARPAQKDKKQKQQTDERQYSCAENGGASYRS